MRRALLCLALCLTAACGRGVPEDTRVVVAGDSVMAWNRVEGASVAAGLSERLGEPVGDVSLPFARITGGRGDLNIPSQLAGVETDWVVLNGGANDLGLSCGDETTAAMERLVSADGTRGAIPALVADLRSRGSRVLWADYYTSPRYAGTACVPIYAEMEARLRRMAGADPGVLLVDMGDVLPSSDLALFAGDRMHPSAAGSARIASLIAGALRAEDETFRR